MGLAELFILAVGLSMDAFAVSICEGLAAKIGSLKKSVVTGLYFGVFQMGMPLLGYLIGSRFREMIEAYDHWIAFALLLFLGGKMVVECLRESDGRAGGKSDGETDSGTDGETDGGTNSLRHMLPLAVATSIDALAVGVSFAFLNVAIVPAVTFIGITTFTLSAVGVYVGRVFGARWKKKAEIAGGVILILIGVKILLEHLGIIQF